MKTAIAALAIVAGALSPTLSWAQMPTSQVILENQSIRVTLLTFAPGGATGRHQSIESEIGIVIEGDLRWRARRDGSSSPPAAPTGCRASRPTTSATRAGARPRCGTSS